MGGATSCKNGAFSGAQMARGWYALRSNDGPVCPFLLAMANRVTPLLTRRIVELHEEGHTLLAIAQQLGLDRHTVARHVSSPLGREEPLAGVTPKVLETLLKLAASVEVFACPVCQAPTLRLRSQHEGWCEKCNRWWGVRAVQGIPWVRSQPKTQVA